MDNYKLFISHSTKDRVLAEAITELLSKVSLKFLDPWFSSDVRSNRGLNPGLWFNQIVDRISNSKSLIAVMTPNSINSPWVYYESGIAQALENCDVIPVCINLNRDNLPFPLKFYQAYQLSDYSSLKEFIAKLLGICGVHFDEELCEQCMKKAIKDFTNFNIDIAQNIDKPLDTVSLFEDLKNHIDKRFLDYMQNCNNDVVALDRRLYTIPIEIPFLKNNSIQYIEIKENDNVQDVLNRIYFLLKPAVPPYTYMQSWILSDKNTGLQMAMYEITKKIPAKYVFTMKSKWQVLKLKKKYDPEEGEMRLDHVTYHRFE